MLIPLQKDTVKVHYFGKQDNRIYTHNLQSIDLFCYAHSSTRSNKDPIFPAITEIKLANSKITDCPVANPIRYLGIMIGKIQGGLNVLHLLRKKR
jgi:hypothetical protein